MTPTKPRNDRRRTETEILRESRRRPASPGHYSNEILRIRNGGVRHQYEHDIGGCSDNYR